MRDGFVAPAYHDRSLGDVLPAVAAAMGVDAGFGRTSLVLPEAQRYVVFLIDGLGYELLRDHPDDAPFLHSLLDSHEPATVGVPSTTATSLTSLGTALSPGTHGIIGYTSRIPGSNRLLTGVGWPMVYAVAAISHRLRRGKPLGARPGMPRGGASCRS